MITALELVNLEEVVGEETLGEIVADLAESLFPEAPRPFPIPPRELQNPVSSRIRISGGWDGDVVLRTSRPFAEHLAERLFLLTAGAASDSDVLDVLGEIVNIVGGNVKAMLPGENHLSLPQPRLRDFGPLPDGLTAVVLWGAEPVQITMTPDLAPARSTENSTLEGHHS